jgi:hypothetical protein
MQASFAQKLDFRQLGRRCILLALYRSGRHHESCAIWEIHDNAAGRFIETDRRWDRSAYTFKVASR